MQRAGRTHRAAANDGMAEMNLRNFFRTCKEVLEEDGLSDEAFYFEQVVDHLNAGKPLPRDRHEIGKLLGL